MAPPRRSSHALSSSCFVGFVTCSVRLAGVTRFHKNRAHFPHRSVIILAGEMLKVAEAFLFRNMHPRVVVSAYMKALETAEKVRASRLFNLREMAFVLAR